MNKANEQKRYSWLNHSFGHHIEIKMQAILEYHALNINWIHCHGLDDDDDDDLPTWHKLLHHRQIIYSREPTTTFYLTPNLLLLLTTILLFSCSYSHHINNNQKKKKRTWATHLYEPASYKNNEWAIFFCSISFSFFLSLPNFNWSLRAFIYHLFN